MFCILFEHLGTNQMNYFTFYTGKDNEKIICLFIFCDYTNTVNNTWVIWYMRYTILNLHTLICLLIIYLSTAIIWNSTFLLWLIKKPNLTAGFRKQKCRTSRLLLWRNILSTLFLTSLLSHFRIFSVVCLFGFKSLDSDQLQAAAKAMHGIWC